LFNETVSVAGTDAGFYGLWSPLV